MSTLLGSPLRPAVSLRLATPALGALLLLGLAACGEGRIGAPLGQADSGLAIDAPAPTIDAATPLPDAAPLPDAPPPPTCDQLYGGAPEYILCDEQPDTCEFNARTDGGDCNEMCQDFGGTCVMAYDNQTGNGLDCIRVEATGDDCTTNRTTEICVCTRN